MIVYYFQKRMCKYSENPRRFEAVKPYSADGENISVNLFLVNREKGSYNFTFQGFPILRAFSISCCGEVSHP